MQQKAEQQAAVFSREMDAVAAQHRCVLAEAQESGAAALRQPSVARSGEAPAGDTGIDVRVPLNKHARLHVLTNNPAQQAEGGGG